MYNIHRSGGPAVWRDKDGYHGACARKFSGGVICCVELQGGQCHADRQAGPRDVPDSSAAPDWCPYLASMIRDAEFMDAMGRLGLDAGKKKDLLAVIRAMPKDKRPKGARGLCLMQLQNAILRARDEGWEMEV
jgi:hypothetical protein